MMVLYHCFMNAELVTTRVQPDINVYLGLVSGSYPFLTGYMVSFHYLDALRGGQAGRLLERGLKLLGIYTLSNLLILAVVADWIPGGVSVTTGDLWRSLITANVPEFLYDILVSLGQILVMGSAVVWLWTRNVIRSPKRLQLLCVGATLILIVLGVHIYLLCGLVGLILGFRSTDAAIDGQFGKSHGLVLGAVLLLGAFAFRQEARHGYHYLPAVVVLFYLLRSWGGRRAAKLPQTLSRGLQRVSEYSLPIYLVHVPLLIAVTQALDPYVSEGKTWQVFGAYAVGVAVTMCYMILVIRRARRHVPWIDSVYRFVMP